jgi:prepilin-type N-terminal cleavage/methylation domain-containing protein
MTDANADITSRIRIVLSENPECRSSQLARNCVVYAERGCLSYRNYRELFCLVRHMSSPFVGFYYGHVLRVRAKRSGDYIRFGNRCRRGRDPAVVYRQRPSAPWRSRRHSARVQSPRHLGGVIPMKNADTLPNARAQRGFTLIEMSIAAAVAIFLGVMILQGFSTFMTYQNAQATGVRVAQYNSAVASFINAAGAAVPTGNYAGVGWLQNAATCAGATGATDFLPCGFNAFLGYGLQYNTRIDTNATNPAVPAGRVLAVTTLGTPRIAAGGEPQMNFGGTMIRAAQAYVGISQLRAQNLVGLTSYRIDLDTIPGGVNDLLIAQVDTSVNVDPWLRIDGTNSMQANLNVGGNDVVNARDVNANRDMNATNNIRAANGRAELWNNGPEGAVLTLRGANGQQVHVQNINGTFRLVNNPWNAELMRVDQAANLSAGRDVAANMNGWGGDVRIVNTAVPGVGPMSLSGAMQGAQILNNPDWFPKPVNCPPGTIPKIFAVAVKLDNNGRAEPIGAIQTRADDYGGSWRVSTVIITPSSTLEPSTVKILAMTACQP